MAEKPFAQEIGALQAQVSDMRDKIEHIERVTDKTEDDVKSVNFKLDAIARDIAEMKPEVDIFRQTRYEAAGAIKTARVINNLIRAVIAFSAAIIGWVISLLPSWKGHP
ncbi:MAG: hypothetical protein C5B50_00895 [Verrucomicrobia bacterium]|nr:MAG: hypothetical protein C5B50_00895 [Verrucomicrobiota bacterium]